MNALFVAAAAVAAASPAARPPAPPSAVTTIDPAALAAARRVVAATDVRGQMRNLMPQIVDAAMGQVRGTFKANAVPDGLVARLQDVFRREMGTLGDVYTPDLLDGMARAYAAHMSAADLARVADIMTDPAMVRFRQQTPAILRDVMPRLMAAMAPRQEALMKAVAKTVADWIRDHPADKARLVKPTVS